MRILMLSDVYFPRVNGVSTSIQSYAKELTTQGHHVTLIAPDYGPTVRTHDDANEPFSILRIPSRLLPIDREDRILKFRAIKALTPRLAAKKFDLIHIHTPFIAHYSGIALAKSLAIPTVETCHTHFEEYLSHYIHFIPKRLLTSAVRSFAISQSKQTTALITPSQAMLRVLLKYGVTTPITVIPTGVNLPDENFGNGLRFRHTYGIAENRPTLVHVGRLAFEKNQMFLLEILAQVRRHIPNVLMILAGEGPARRDLEQRGRALGLTDNLLFVGYLTRNGPLEDCYCAGNIFVFASRTETQGLVLLEAMSLGIPVISTAAMGTCEVLQEGRGAIIAIEDIQDFSTKTVSLLSDLNLQRDLGQKARNYAKEWSIPTLTQRLLNCYENILSNNNL